MRRLPLSARGDTPRLVLGMLEMFGAVVSLTLVFINGVSRLSLTAVVLTSLATAVSVLLYGRGGRSRDS